jgi:phospholipase C
MPQGSAPSRWHRALVGMTAGVALLLGLTAVASAHQARGQIRHVVVIYQENHSFDNVFGRFCVRTNRCDGTRTGKLPGGRAIRLRRSPDLVPAVGHTGTAQKAAINGGRMDGWESDISGCARRKNYACLSQFGPGQIPNLTRLARNFSLSDRTFYTDSVSTWGAHLELVSGTLDGFVADRIPHATRTSLNNAGWGCDSRMDTGWRPLPGAPITQEPACVPDYGLGSVRYPYGGAYRPTPVHHVPTLMDELDRAGLSWKLYTATAPGRSGYGLAICPTFAGCLYTSQHRNLVEHRAVLEDAKRGHLPNFSIVLPTWKTSQHNLESMALGDNWIGKVVSKIEHGPDWRSTAILISYDDCGCFYDHVPPPKGMGIRTPMVMVSPWVKPGYVDSRVTSIASVMAFTERTFGLPALTSRDAAAYSYRHAFDFHQPPLKPVPMSKSKIPRAERKQIMRRGRPPGMT